MFVACDHPSLLAKDFSEELKAINPDRKQSSQKIDADADEDDDEEVDDLVQQISGLGLAKVATCGICLGK
jgi:hypothetical protein